MHSVKREILMKPLNTLALIVVVALQQSAVSQDALQFNGEPYIIVARHSGMGMDVQNAGGQMALVQTAGLGGQPNREFNIDSIGGGFYTIAARHSGLTFDVRDAATQPIFFSMWPVVQTAGTGGQANREFAITPIPGGYYKISARHSGLSFDVREARGEGSLVQTAGDGGQSNREWLIIPVKSVASKAYARTLGTVAKPPSLMSLLTRNTFTFSANIPVSSHDFCVTDVTIRNVKFGLPTTDASTHQLVIEVTADVDPFAVVYTTDVNGPPMQLEGKTYDRVIMFPIQIGILVPNGRFSGSIRSDGKQLSGSIKFSCNGLIAVGTPAQAGIPVPGGDNDPGDGPGGWEYKTWDRPFEGVRQPRRDDLKGAPEFIRANGGPLNGYLFLRPKAHPITINADVEIDATNVTAKTMSLKFDRPFVKCPDDFKKAWNERFDWDYAVDASGPFAGLVQDAFENDVVSAITKATSQPISAQLSP